MKKEYVKKGERFYHWTVVDDLGYINGSRKLLCKCDCGKEKEVLYTHLKRGNTKSCGLCNYQEVSKGDFYGHWKVLSVQEKVPRGSQRMAECQCDCGIIKKVCTYKLTAGLSTGCGHWKSNAKAYPRLYTVYHHMIARCYNANDAKYKDYGARGIKVCEEWYSDNGFDRFADWAYKNGYDENAKNGECTIDRIDVNGNYEPSNCRWANAITQANNKRNNVYLEYNGQRHTMAEWSRILKINYETMRRRYHQGYSVENILFCGKFAREQAIKE